MLSPRVPWLASPHPELTLISHLLHHEASPSRDRQDPPPPGSSAYSLAWSRALSVSRKLTPYLRPLLIICQVGSLAQKRLARGLKLNKTEATALIACQLQEYIRDGKHSVAELMQLGKEMLGRRHVLAGVVPLLHEIMVEGTFPDGQHMTSHHLRPVHARH
jgi:urease gamma subunit